MSSMRFVCVHKTLAPGTDEPCEFLVMLASHILFPNGLPWATWTERATRAIDRREEPICAHDEMVRIITVARQLRMGIQQQTRPNHDAHIMSMSCIRELLTLKISNDIVRQRLEEYRPMFAPVHLDCQLLTRPLLTEFDIYPTELARENRFKTERATRTLGEYVSEDHIRRWAIAWKHQDDSDYAALSKILPVDLSLMDTPLTAFADSVRLLVQNHLQVYHDIYAAKGILMGSGTCTRFEMEQSRGRRMAANVSNKHRTHISAALSNPDPGNCNTQ